MKNQRQTSSITRAALCVCATAVLSAGLLRADIMYSSGADGTTLVRINTTTAVGTTIGALGTTATYAGAFDPTTGEFYTLANSYLNAQLASVNLTTGAATVFGAPVGIPDMMVMEVAADGTMYTASWSTNTLYTMNKSTGVATPIGALGFGSVMDFAFDNSGTLYAVNSTQLWTVNTATGAGTLLTNLTGPSSCIMGLSFDSANNLFGTDYCSANSPLYAINRITGVETSVGFTGIANPHGGDILVAAPVPEPSAIVLLLTALLGTGICIRRRK
jgi:hypothetical protein